jgi:outer membrane protein assembly factor BamB
MTTRRRTFTLTLMCAGMLAAPLFATASEPALAVWPQYRGPTRDGIVPPGPKLLDTWPKEGPRQLWKTPALWPKKGGQSSKGGTHLANAGCGSIAIAGGRAFLLANFKRDVDKPVKVVLSTKDLNELGWTEGVPEDLAKKIEEERIHGKSAKMKPGPQLDAYVKQYAAALDPELARKFGPCIERRLGKIPPSFKFNRLIQAGGSTAQNGDPFIEWSYLEKLAGIRDKEFPSIGALDTTLSGTLNPWSNQSGNGIRVMLANRTISFFDSVLCLDAATGNELWRKEWPGEISPYAGTAELGASGTPAVWDDKCFVAGSAGMYCMSAKDGSVVWQAKTAFTNSSPLVMDGVVYVMVPEATAYDAQTGKVVWCQPGLNHSNSSFTRWTSGGKNLLLLHVEGSVYDTPGGGIYCLDPASGKTVWHTFGPGNQLPVITGGDTLLMAGMDTRAFKITAEKADKLWESKGTNAGRGESPLVFEDNVYMSGGCHSDNPLRCLNLKTGETKWNPRKMPSAETSSPVLADGKIIALLEEAEESLFVVMYRATPEKYEELGRFNPKAGPGASPAIVDGRMYLRLQDAVACYDLRAQ